MHLPVSVDASWIPRLTIALTLCLTSGAIEASLPDPTPNGDTQLIVLFDSNQPSSPSAAQIVDAVSGRLPNESLLTLLGSPKSAGRVLESVTTPQMREELAKTPRSRRALLDEYVLLTYASADLAKSALAQIGRDNRVLSVQPNTQFALSVSPTDKYFALDPSQPANGNYQWGMSLLNMPTAWNLGRGTAYITAVDAGIDCGGIDPCTTTALHPDLRQNTRLHFSKNFFDSGAGVLTNDDISHCAANPCEAAHGTHVAGIMVATPNYGSYSNGSTNSGVAGTCWTCSFAMMRINEIRDATISAAITYAVDHGFQVMNMSFGDHYATTRYANCSTAGYSLQCQALAYAADLDVVAVAASGNGYVNRIQFPARFNSVVAVGGAEFGGVFWRHGYGATCTTPGTPGTECGSNWGTQDDNSTPQIVGPALDIVSTMYRAHDYFAALNCGDTIGPDPSDPNNGYGDCTGTSMASPYVSGLAGLIRSIDPLLSRQDVKTILLTQTNACTGTDQTLCGNGFPDAARAIRIALGDPLAKNRLTPLFSFYSASIDDHVYVIAPQMAVAAGITGRLLPQPPTGSVGYGSIGVVTPAYAQFPQPASCFSPCPYSITPRAMVSVFTSHVDPTDAASELVPLYRMSWVCSGSCGRVSHTYTTSSTGIAAFQSVGYRLDGIEGYIYPSSKAQPPGTVKLCRKYSLARDDYVLFPGTGANGTTCGNSDGFTDKDGNGVPDTAYSDPVGGTDWIGWVYKVRGPTAVCNGGIPCSAIQALPAILGD